MINLKKVLFSMLLLILTCLSGPAAGRTGENVVLRPEQTDQAPKIDAVLDDHAWKNGPIVQEPFVTNGPVYGKPLPEKTKVWISYDADNLYFAFYCYDDPKKIKSTLAKRDGVLGDDWIDVDIDTMGTRQFTLENMCNPLGIQTDLINSASGGESTDPDWVWYSAGRIVEDGYIVEMRIPLKSIKFRSGENVTMHMGFYRNQSHSGTNSSWPQIDQKLGYFNSLAPVVFKKLDNQLRLEALPAVTYGGIWDRQTPEKWSAADQATQIGLGMKYGITSSVNAELTVNPDFSQVESDQFQIMANQRYPIFYSEKRPFFMDINNQFNLAGTNGPTNMGTAVHTRNIVDPFWGAKLSGELNKFSFGVLAAGDEWPGESFPGYQSPFPGKNANYFIGRMKYSLNGGDYFGLLYSGREFGDTSNRVLAGDLNFRLPGGHNISVNGIYTLSRDAEAPQNSAGNAFTVLYNYGQKPLNMLFALEGYSRDFRMDSAFYLQNGFTRFTGFISPQFYPKSGNAFGLTRISTSLYGYYSHNLFNGLNDIYLEPSIRFSLPRNSYVGFEYTYFKEGWLDRSFDQSQLGMFWGTVPSRRLNLHGSVSYGTALRYDFSDPFLGNKFNFHFGAQYQPNNRITQAIEYTYQDFRRDDNKEHVFDLNIIVSRTTYQFSKSTFVRALVQYDSYSKKVITDLLASFTLIPGTVLYVGYGSLFREQFWDGADAAWKRQPGMGNYYQTAQSLFIKASYLWRF
ncbi:MAG TPA: DUF5916 domain-containing protein [Candidatus Binatia bacterium]|nr:DUF5916 domain-containing protein [Candidatus Binatia bacterium]